MPSSSDQVEQLAEALYRATNFSDRTGLWDWNMADQRAKTTYRRRAEHLIADGWTKPE